MLLTKECAGRNASMKKNGVVFSAQWENLTDQTRENMTSEDIPCHEIITAAIKL
jgi:hypothetical protein